MLVLVLISFSDNVEVKVAEYYAVSDSLNMTENEFWWEGTMMLILYFFEMIEAYVD